MDKEYQELFVSNVQWFNQFFFDLNTLFEYIAAELIENFDLDDNKYYYYSKSDYRPSIPDYYVMGMHKKEDYAIQVYAIINPGIVKNPHPFRKEPSFVIVKHSRGDRAAYHKDFGLRVISGNGVPAKESHEVISGKILGKEITHFHSFQVLFDLFLNLAPKEAINTAIVEKLRSLETWIDP